MKTMIASILLMAGHAMAAADSPVDTKAPLLLSAVRAATAEGAPGGLTDGGLGHAKHGDAVTEDPSQNQPLRSARLRNVRTARG